MGKVSEVVCGDSSTVVRSHSGNDANPSSGGDKVYGWGRGYSIERATDVSRFKPKELSAIET